MLDKLLDLDTDSILMETMKETTYPTFEYASFQNYVTNSYSNLSKYVHFGGKRDIADFSFEFSEYNGEQFDMWEKYFNQIIECCNLLTLIKFTNFADAYSEAMKRENGEAPLLTLKQIELVKRKLDEFNKVA